MTTIYQQHDAAFKNVSAYAIFKNGELVAKIAFKFPKDGAGRLYAYVHWYGIQMVRGYANGYGYDKRSAAAEAAVSKIVLDSPESMTNDFKAFEKALSNIGGNSFDNALHNAGFVVFAIL